MAGILAQGLRIAPPEAPVTGIYTSNTRIRDIDIIIRFFTTIIIFSSIGYMFGKGIYFADMVSKSANYCVTSKSNPVGLLLLCDVALGSW